MQLTPDILHRFKEGRFDDFLDEGATQLKQRFAFRFEGFDDADRAHDAGRNLVGESYELACALGRNSGLLAMRIAFLRAALGFGVLTDPRHDRVHEMVEAQAKAAAIKPNTSIATYLTNHMDSWQIPAFSRASEPRAALLQRIRREVEDWPQVLQHLVEAHAQAGTGHQEPELKQFINAVWSDGWALGLTSPEASRLHVLASDALGFQFYLDPLLPHWQAAYATGDPSQIMAQLRDACEGSAS